MRGLYRSEVIGSKMRVCLAGAEDWQPLDSFPELVPHLVTKTPLLPTAPPRRPRPRKDWAILAFILFVSGLIYWVLSSYITHENRLGVTSFADSAASVPTLPTPLVPPPVTAPSPTPDPHVENGTLVAHRILDENPKLKVMILSGITFQKPDGIEFGGAGATPSISFILPEAAWKGLTDGERVDLQAYVASRVAYARSHVDAYMIIPKSAPD